VLSGQRAFLRGIDRLVQHGSAYRVHMKRIALLASLGALLLVSVAFGPPLGEYPSKVSRVLATYSPAPEKLSSAKSRATAAQVFLKGLSKELREQCALALEDKERQRWTNVPPRAKEGGARLGDLSQEELKLACNLLAAVLSPEGYAKVRDIMLADDLLLRGGAPRVGFGAENFWVAIFGEPTAIGTWGLQLDGHHLALNLTFNGEEMTMSPSFIGTQPAAYERENVQVVPMRRTAHEAFELFNSLSSEQRGTALQSAKRGQITTGPGTDGVVPKTRGVSCAGFDEKQRLHLTTLLRQFVSDLPKEIADTRMIVLEAEIDSMFFAWSGPSKNPSDVSYTVQGPTVIAEYACQDLGGDPLNHLHSMYRDPQNEYGSAYAE
jgi:hypothetical protein